MGSEIHSSVVLHLLYPTGAEGIHTGYRLILNWFDEFVSDSKMS